MACDKNIQASTFREQKRYTVFCQDGSKFVVFEEGGGWILCSAEILQHEMPWPLKTMNMKACSSILCPTRQNVCLRVSPLLPTSETRSFIMDIKDCEGSFLICLPDVKLKIVTDPFCSNNAKRSSTSHENILRQKRDEAWNADLDDLNDDTYNSHSNNLRTNSENNECTTSCMADKEMVCGTDANHQYKTFLSICHMKAYNCINPNMKIKLAIRKPCMLSYPIHIGTVLKRPAEEDNHH